MTPIFFFDYQAESVAFIEPWVDLVSCLSVV